MRSGLFALALLTTGWSRSAEPPVKEPPPIDETTRSDAADPDGIPTLSSLKPVDEAVEAPPSGPPVEAPRQLPFELLDENDAPILKQPRRVGNVVDARVITVTPADPPRRRIVPIAGWEADQKDAQATALRMSPAPRTRRLGDLLIVTVKVSDAAGAGLGDQPVEWILHRHGVGQIIASGGADRVAGQGRRSSGTFARTTTAREPYRLDSKLKLPEPIEIAVGEAWCLVDAQSPGDLRITALAPTIAGAAARVARGRTHWHDVRTVFPKPIAAATGTRAPLVVQVVDSAGAPLSGYRVRFEAPSEGLARFGSGVAEFELESDSQGIARAVLQQQEPAEGTSTVRMRIFGRQSFPGAAVELEAESVEVRWVDPGLTLDAQGPPTSTIGAPFEVSVEVAAAGLVPIPNAVVVARPGPGVRLLTEDGKGVSTDDGLSRLGRFSASQPFSAAVRAQGAHAGIGSIRFEVRDGSTVRAAQRVEVRLVAPEVKITKTYPTPWRVGRRGVYSISIENPNLVAVERLELRDEFPEGLRIDRTDAARRRNQLVWVLDRLEPGQRRSYQVMATPLRPFGHRRLGASITGSDEVYGTTTADLEVTGMAALSVSVRDLADPTPVGGMVEFLVEVRNRGTGPAAAVQPSPVAWPENLRFIDSRGALGAMLREGELRFSKIDSLSAGTSVDCRIRAVAIAPGEARLKLRLDHAALGKRGIETQESSIVYDPTRPSIAVLGAAN